MDPPERIRVFGGRTNVMGGFYRVCRYDDPFLELA